MMETIVLRLVGAATLFSHVGGYGPVVATPEAATDALLAGRSARVPADWREAVRSVLAARALAGQGPDGKGRNWSGDGVDHG